VRRETPNPNIERLCVGVRFAHPNLQVLAKHFVTPAKAGVQFINFLLLPGVQQTPLHPFGGVNTVKCVHDSPASPRLRRNDGLLVFTLFFLSLNRLAPLQGWGRMSLVRQNHQEQ
jgi:hypothetical protein